MRAPAFWWRRSPGLPALLLSPLGAIYGAVVARRMRAGGWKCSVPVICIGNFTAGGAGKTPLAIAIAKMLIEAGEKPAFLTRGYGGSHQGAPLRVDPLLPDARQVGDEPLLLARHAPTFVCADRVAGAKAAIAAGASVIVMDDGMQNPALHKDLTLAVVDGAVGAGNQLCMPAGPLRAPLAVQLPMVDAIIFSGDRKAPIDVFEVSGKPIFSARLVANRAVADKLRGARVYAFAGIGRPEKFFETLASLGSNIVGRRAFADHHLYSADEMTQLKADASALNAQLVTTEKDKVRLPDDDAITALPIEMEIDRAENLKQMLLRVLDAVRQSDLNPQTGELGLRR